MRAIPRGRRENRDDAKATREWKRSQGIEQQTMNEIHAFDFKYHPFVFTLSARARAKGDFFSLSSPFFAHDKPSLEKRECTRSHTSREEDNRFRTRVIRKKVLHACAHLNQVLRGCAHPHHPSASFTFSPLPLLHRAQKKREVPAPNRRSKKGRLATFPSQSTRANCITYAFFFDPFFPFESLLFFPTAMFSV